MTHPSDPPALFSRRPFIEACAESFGPRYKPFQVPAAGSPTGSGFFTLEYREPLRLRSFALSPCGLYASPGAGDAVKPAALEHVVSALRGVRVRKFGWKVYFPHAQLAAGLRRFGLLERREPTQALYLEDGYERVFAGYAPSLRTQVRKARRADLVVRDAVDETTVRAYYEMHTQLARQKGTYEYIYPLALFLRLVCLPEVRLLVVEHEGAVIAGGLFFREPDWIVYWHGATDRAFSRRYPSRLVFDEIVQWGCRTGARFLDFGGSAGIAELESFKALWGARYEQNSVFEWNHPVWAAAVRIKRRYVAARRADHRPIAAMCSTVDSSRCESA
jgi:hypothetical protein